VVEIRGKVGEIIAVHAVMVVFELGGSSASAAAPGAANGGSHGNGHAAKDDGPAATAVGDIKESLPGMAARAPASALQSSGAASVVSAYFNDKPLATPATRKLARDMSVDLRQVPPSGPQGRVTRTDVESFKRAPAPAASPTRAPAGTPAQPVHIAPGPAEERVPFAGMRRKIAQKMAQSVHTAAHFTFVEECDVTQLKALRARLKAPAEAAGVKLSFLHPEGHRRGPQEAPDAQHGARRVGQRAGLP